MIIICFCIVYTANLPDEFDIKGTKFPRKKQTISFGDALLSADGAVENTPSTPTEAVPPSPPKPGEIDKTKCMVCAHPEWMRERSGKARVPVCYNCMRFYYRRLHDQIEHLKEFPCKNNSESFKELCKNRSDTFSIQVINAYLPSKIPNENMLKYLICRWLFHSTPSG